MMRQLILALLFSAFVSVAHAACPPTLELQDANNVKAAAKYTDDGLGNCQVNTATQDGADVALGSRADTAWSGTGSGSTVALLKAIATPATPFHVLSTASTNANNVKASPGVVYNLVVVQTTTTLGDFRFYDTASSPTCSSATGVVANFPVQSNATSPGFQLTFPAGLKFANGIAFCLTGAVSDSDNTNFVTGVTINISYN